VSERRFQFRLCSHHPPPDRASTDLRVELLDEKGEWRLQPPGLDTPGFRLFLLSLLLCQHFYLVANARERGLPLLRVDGEFTVTTGADWILQRLDGLFRLRLDPAAPAAERRRADAEAIAFIAERMKLCPVSRNLPAAVAKAVAVRVEDGENCSPP
jgi:hypothetical protein